MIPLVKVRCAGDVGHGKCGALLGTVMRGPGGSLVFERQCLEDRRRRASNAGNAKLLPRDSWTETDALADPSKIEQHFALYGCDKHHNDHLLFTGGAEVGGAELWAKATQAAARQAPVTLMVHPQRCTVD